MIACHDCDHLHRYEPIPAGARADCRYCGALLYRHVPESLNQAIALYLSALVLFFIANCFPFLSLKLSGRIVENLLLSGGWALYQYGMGEVGALIFFTSIAFPFLVIAGMLYLLIPIRFGLVPPGVGMVYRLVHAVSPWSLVGVFMLGVLIAIVKLQDLATVITGTSLYAVGALMLAYAAARASFEPRTFWEAVPLRRQPALDSAKTGFVACHVCGLLSAAAPAAQGRRCARCQAPLHERKPDSVERTWALLFSATILMVPANVYPVLTVIRFGQGEPNTILGGILHLIESGNWGLALIVFFASIVVPILKIIVLGYLLWSIHNGMTWRPRDRTVLFRITESVGSWSMVDVFLVGLLSALVSLDALSTIRPGIGASFFAAVVVLTMFAAQSFDPRLIWDNARGRGASC
ncbi:MAG: paraquat-inducible protein A [Gammaproteobacteria bacterium]|nr:paraquat-inducible protein A [Gammaproteobacteria bacterium]